MGVLTGYRVLDCSIAMAGPFAAQRLGDLGADVVKVEPITGEWQRHVAAGGAKGKQINVSFLSLNRNKRSLAVDLKHPEGKAVLTDLVRSADVFLQNYRPGVAKRLGVDYETLSAINPRLVYVSMSGYGESGPYMNWPGQDLVLQGLSGAMLSAGREGEAPTPAGQYLVDAVTASTAFEGALAALLHRERTGEGQLVTVNMLDAITTLQMQELSIFTVGGKPQTRSAEPHAHVYIRAPYGAFPTKDGSIIVAFPSLKTLGELIGEPSFLAMDDERDSWAHRDEIYRKTCERLKEKTSAAWLSILRAGIWCGPVYGYADLVDDPQIAHNGTFVEYDHPTEGRVKTPGFPYKFSRTPPTVERGAPLAGEHTREILGEAGYDAARPSTDLFERGIVAGDAAVNLRGLTWDHPRGYAVLDALGRMTWHRQSLEDFESRPIAEVADHYDLLVIDHPGLGDAIAADSLQPLDNLFDVAELTGYRNATVGSSYDSYTVDGRQWALPLHAAAQVAVATRAMAERPRTWDEALRAATRHTPPRSASVGRTPS